MGEASECSKGEEGEEERRGEEGVKRTREGGEEGWVSNAGREKWEGKDLGFKGKKG